MQNATQHQRKEHQNGAKFAIRFTQKSPNKRKKSTTAMGKYNLRTAESRPSELNDTTEEDAVSATPPASPSCVLDQTPACFTQQTPRSSQLIVEVVDMWREATTPRKVPPPASATSPRPESSAEDDYIDAVSDETMLALINQQELTISSPPNLTYQCHTNTNTATTIRRRTR